MPKKRITTEQEKSVLRMYMEGHAGSEVSEKLGISLKQVYDALRRWSVPRRGLKEQHRIRLMKKPPSYSFKKNLTVKERELLIAGLMLYYGEGAKTGNTVDFANSDLILLQLFLRFLRKIFSVDERRLRFYLYCFEDQDSSELIRFWCSHLGVESGQFTKPYVRSTFNKGKRTMMNGVLHIRYSDKRLLEEILQLGHTYASTL